MEDVYVTVLEHSNYEDSGPLGVFESHAAAEAHILEHYGAFPGMGEIEPDWPEVYIHPDRWPYLELILYRLPLGSARVLNVVREDIRTQARS